MTSFSLVSLNTFGLPFYMGGRGRLARTAGEVARLTPDVICLQEIQDSGHLYILERRLPEHIYRAFEPHWRAPMGGLYTASRLPIDQHRFLPFPNRGNPLGIGIQDWMTHKGILLTQIRAGEQPIVVLNSHTQANYSADWSAEGSFTRIQVDQVQFMVEQVRAQPAEALVILCGDFNFHRQTTLYQELVSGAELVDPLQGDPRPTYRPFPLVPAAKWSIPLDFVLYRSPVGRQLEVAADVVPIEDALARLAVQRFLTDHCALTLSMEWPD